MYYGKCEGAVALISPLAPHKLGYMQNVSSGLGGFTLCLLIGIILDQVALGIIAGLFLGGALGTAKAKRSEDSSDDSGDKGRDPGA